MTPHPNGQQTPVPTEEERRGLPAPGYHGVGSGAEAETRKPLAWWDRIKFLLLFFLLFWFFVWSEVSDDNPFNTFGDALENTLRTKWPLFVAIGLELVRQLHYLVAERSPRYYRFWTEKVFGRWERRTRLLDDWNRYRIARAMKLMVLLGVVSVVIAAMYDVSPVTALFELPSRIWGWLPRVFQLMFAMVFLISQFAALFWFLSRGGVDTYMPDEVKTRFSDVWGQDAVLERVKENMVFLETPEQLENKGGHVPGGILLWGPPGTGKTLMAEAVAGETGKPYVFVDPGAFRAMFLGVGIMKVKALFKKLRKLALRYGGVIVFFDEADVLGNRGGAVSQNMRPADDDLTFGPNACGGVRYLSTRTQSFLFEQQMRPSQANDETRRATRIHKIIMGGMAGGGGMGELQALLTELSGLKKPRGIFWRRIRAFFGIPQRQVPRYRILVMMATNMPSSLDSALLRPGRLDRIYKVGYPSKAGRKKTYEGYFGRIKHSVTPTQIDRLATITPYATGASIKDLVNESLIVALRNGRDFVTWPDVVSARKMKMVGPGENVDYIERERHAIALHEASHAVMAYRVQKGHDIDLATIEKGSDFLGFVTPIPMEEMFTDWRSTYEADILVSLASLAGERIFFDNDNSSGVTGDLQNATSLALAMEAFWGMGQTVGSHLATKVTRRGASAEFEDGTDRNVLETELGRRVEARLQRLLQQATRLIQENRFEVLAVAHALEAYKTITGEDIDAIINGYPGPLVDGRPYHQAKFIEVAEAYHQRVISAHREQGRVDMALPVFAGEVAAAAAAYNYRADESAPPPPPPPPPFG